MIFVGDTNYTFKMFKISLNCKTVKVSRTLQEFVKMRLSFVFILTIYIKASWSLLYPASSSLGVSEMCVSSGKTLNTNPKFF